MKLVSIPQEAYADYKYEVIFKAYKWDPQVGDHNTVSKHVVLMEKETALYLEECAEKLSLETMFMEESLAQREDLVKKLGLPREIRRQLPLLKSYNRGDNVRLMRFDFHPTESGWSISEVNSDVPGGFAEASVLPRLADKYFSGYVPQGDLVESLCAAIVEKIKRPQREATVAFVYATSYADDRQVMQCVGDRLGERDIKTVFAAPDQIEWRQRRAFCALQNESTEVDAIIRFFPLDWLAYLPKKTNWKGYFDCQTPSCNHPVSMLTQSKRLPVVWDGLNIDIPTWKELLPTTKDPKEAKAIGDEWILKPALGRVGEGISIKEAVSAKEMKYIKKDAKKHPLDWVAQQRFKSVPLTAENGEEYHLCVGVFTVDGKRAGFYGRISPYPRIDANARDIAILVSDK